jgi:SAM-dependent methyltransferase
MAVERIIPDELAPQERTLTEHMERYELAAALLQPEDVVVDVACGVGYGAALLARQCRHVYGYDNAPEAIAHAVEHYGCNKIEFAVLNLDTAALAACDVIVSFETIEHLREPKPFLEKAKSAANRLIILSTPIVPTRAFNPFHLHDFDREVVEAWMCPWQPAYFCVQAGEGNVPSGVWVFTKSETVEPSLLALNLRHQQTQIWHQYAFLERQQAWVKELEQGNAWLEDERAKWQRQAEDHVQRLQVQEAWSRELEQGKAWLEEQRANWQRLAEAREQSVEALRGQTAQLEQQCHAWQRTAQAQQRDLEALRASSLFRLLTRLRLLPFLRSTVDP